MPPVRLRFDAKTLVTLFNRGDQAFLDAFSDITVIKKGRRPTQMEEPKFSLQDSDERCPNIDFYSYSVKPMKFEKFHEYKKKDYYDFTVFHDHPQLGMLGF